jgi:hypothetical protein
MAHVRSVRRVMLDDSRGRYLPLRRCRAIGHERRPRDEARATAMRG